jgi:hypothetical protein
MIAQNPGKSSMVDFKEWESVVQQQAYEHTGSAALY